MSADNYYTVKLNPEDLKFYVCHGFMSTLEDGWPATIREGQAGYDLWEDAQADAHSEWSEYGVITEPGGFADIVTDAQAEKWARETIETLRHYLGEGDSFESAV